MDVVEGRPEGVCILSLLSLTKFNFLKYYRQCQHGVLSIADTSQGTPDHNDVDSDDGEEKKHLTKIQGDFFTGSAPKSSKC